MEAWRGHLYGSDFYESSYASCVAYSCEDLNTLHLILLLI